MLRLELKAKDLDSLVTKIMDMGHQLSKLKKEGYFDLEDEWIHRGDDFELEQIEGDK